MAIPYRLDRPVDLSDEGADAFGHRDYSEALAETLGSVSAPFTLGLFGEWGSGKTTIIEDAKRRLEASDDAAVVLFDAWRYEGDALRREFLTDISAQLQEGGHLKRRFNRRRLLDELRSERSQTGKAKFPGWKEFLTNLAQVSLAALLLWLTLWLLEKKLHLSSTVVERSYPVVLSAALVFALNTVVRAVRVEHVQVRTPRLQDPDMFARRFRRLVRGLKVKRLVIAIDNLDRCAPDRVTELLGTIKTFLEPDDIKADLIFVIAADDAALRRHLTAQEMKLSPSTGDADAAEEAARHAVDEYLRKFFNATLRVSDALDEELHSYTERELADFFESHDVGQEVRDDLVGMVVSALRRNPRRIKQFVNNLQLKLDLLRARESSGRISPPVSGDLRLVAKFLIIEEQWPDRYEQLRRDHRQLGKWHREGAPSKRRKDKDYQDDPDDSRDDAFDAFLFSTAHIDDRQARAVIHLKLDADELSLPAYADFIDALDSGNSEAVESLLKSADDDQEEGYAKLTKTRFATQFKRSHTEALNTIRVLSEVKRLRELDTSSAAWMVDEAARHRVMAPRLAGIRDFAGLLDTAAPLDDERLSRLVEGIALAFEHGPDDGRPKAEIFEPLVPYVGRLDLASQTAVRALIASIAARSKGAAESYVALTEADPRLLPLQAVEAAFEVLPTGSELAADHPAYKVVVLGVVHGIAPDGAATKLLQLTLNSLRESALPQGMLERSNDLAASVVKWVPKTVDLDQQVVQQEAQALRDFFPHAHDDTRDGLTLVVIEMLKTLEKPQRDVMMSALASTGLSQWGAQAFPFYAEHYRVLTPSMQYQLGQALVPFIAGAVGSATQQEEALAIVVALPQPGSHLSPAGQQAASQLHPGALRRVLQRHELMSSEELSPVIDSAVNNLGNPAAGTEALAEPLLELDPSQMTEAQLTRLRNWVTQFLDTGPQDNGRSFLAAAQELPNWRHATRAITQDIGQRITAGASGNLAGLATEMALVAQAAEDFAVSERHEMTLAVLSGLPSELPLLAEAGTFLQAISEQASSEDRRNYVEQLIAIERGQGTNLGPRRQLLLVARGLAPNARSKAGKSLRDRIGELEAGDEQEQQLAQDLLTL